MGKVVQIEEHKATKGGWISGVGKCLACGHEYAQVMPIELAYTKMFTECPSCHCHKMIYKYPVERDMEHWNCNCGNAYFLVTKMGIYCPNCGAWQEFPNATD